MWPFAFSDVRVASVTVQVIQKTNLALMRMNFVTTTYSSSGRHASEGDGERQMYSRQGSVTDIESHTPFIDYRPN